MTFMLLLMSRLPAIENPHRKPDPSDLSDAEWFLKPLLPVYTLLVLAIACLCERGQLRSENRYN